MINSSSDSLNINNSNIYNNNHSDYYGDSIFFEPNNRIINTQNINNYHESRIINQNNNYRLIPFGLDESSINLNDIYSDNLSNNYIKFQSMDKSTNNENILENNLFNINSQNSQMKQKSSKILKYLLKNNLIKENKIIENDMILTKEKQSFEKELKNNVDKLKCKSCNQIPKQFFICPDCYSIYCKNCLGKDDTKKLTFCKNCKKLKPKENFIKMPIFNKILTYINSIKENNEKLFNNKIKDNLDKNKILCSEKIHNINAEEDFLNININDFRIGNEAKAVYFCIECQKPFCSDCILDYKLKKNKKENNIDNINSNENCNIIGKDKDKDKDDVNNTFEKEDEKIKKHNFAHPIFKIDLLKDIGIFDLLYEKEKSENIAVKLDLFEQYFNERIDHLNKRKQNILLFLDYIKKIYISKVEEVINELKNISKEKNEKIKIINQKNEEVSKFLNSIKTKYDLKNDKSIKIIKEFLNDLSNFHKIPDEIKGKASKYMKFKGIFDLEEITNYKSNINLKTSNYLNNSKIKITYEKNKDLSEDDENENIIIEEKKINVIYNLEERKKNDNDANNKKANEFFEPILINYNCDKNKFINLSEIQKNVISKKKGEEAAKINNKIYNFFFNEDEVYDDSDSIIINTNPFMNKKNDAEEHLIREKKYYAEINIKDLKKINDDSYEIDFEIYNIKIF